MLFCLAGSSKLYCSHKSPSITLYNERNPDQQSPVGHSKCHLPSLENKTTDTPSGRVRTMEAVPIACAFPNVERIRDPRIVKDQLGTRQTVYRIPYLSRSEWNQNADRTRKRGIYQCFRRAWNQRGFLQTGDRFANENRSNNFGLKEEEAIFRALR